MLTLTAAVSRSHIDALTALVAAGFIVAIVGHIIRSRPLIVAGLIITGVIACYFAFVLQPGSK